MEQQPDQVPLQASSSNRSPFDYTRLFLPAAIVIAGLFIGIAIVYSRSGALPAAISPASVLSADNFKKWAREINLDGKTFDTCYDSNAYSDEIAKDSKDGTDVGVNGTPGFFINGIMISGAQPFATFQNEIEAALRGEKRSTPVAVSDDGDPALGSPTAPVTMIEFSDYQCPFCLRFWQDTLPQIKATYIDTGKVRFVYRDFPLNIHSMAQPAARAANCAGEQGKYWEMHDKIFSEQG